MNMREPDRPSAPQPTAIGDQNVERLLANAYQPESLDPAFVRRVHARANAAAKAGRREVIASPDRSSAGWTMGLSLAVAGSALAVVLAVAYFVNRPVDYYPDGELIWIDGLPYAPVAASNSKNGPGPAVALAQVEPGAGQRWACSVASGRASNALPSPTSRWATAETGCHRRLAHHYPRRASARGTAGQVDPVFERRRVGHHRYRSANPA